MRDNIQLELDRGGKLGELETKAGKETRKNPFSYFFFEI
jgi:hypothetical protein